MNHNLLVAQWTVETMESHFLATIGDIGRQKHQVLLYVVLVGTNCEIKTEQGVGTARCGDSRV